MLIRPIAAADRDPLERALHACGAFLPDEIQVALEVMDVGLQQGMEGDYSHLVAADGEALGYVCVGRTPMTTATWHLYWVCVDPSAQGRGVGRALQQAAEEWIRSRNGRILVLETAGKDLYVRTRRFYEANGYVEEARIRDFYQPGDDCVYYVKRLG